MARFLTLALSLIVLLQLLSQTAYAQEDALASQEVIPDDDNTTEANDNSDDSAVASADANDDEDVPEDLDDIDYAAEQSKELELEAENARKSKPVSSNTNQIGTQNDLTTG